MSAFLAELWAAPPEAARPLSRYTVACGVFYMLLGLGFFVGAGPVLALVEAIEGSAPDDVGLLRALGMAVAFIGWFYIAGGRTGTRSFPLATVVDRVLVPAFLVPLWWIGELPATLALPLAVLDPVLGLVALALWARERGGRGSDDG